MVLHSRVAVTISASVARRSRADGSSMEGHTSLSTALVFPLVKHAIKIYTTRISAYLLAHNELNVAILIPIHDAVVSASVTKPSWPFIF